MLALGLLAMLGLFASIFFIIRNIRKKRPVKKLVILALACAFVIIGAGGNLDETEESADLPMPTVSANAITIVAGEQGDYGELLTLNAGTEFEENYFVYRLPAGTYKATNVGAYMDQISVYGETVYTTAEGWEELSDTGDIKVLDPNASDTITIAEGQIIEIHEPGKWMLEKMN